MDDLWIKLTQVRNNRIIDKNQPISINLQHQRYLLWGRVIGSS